MRRLLLCLPLCALVAPSNSGFSPNYGSSRSETKTFVDDEEYLPDGEGMRRLARTDPIGFLEYCLRRYKRTVKGYTAVMCKQERLGGRLGSWEVISITHRRQPNSTLFRWT